MIKNVPPNCPPRIGLERWNHEFRLLIGCGPHGEELPILLAAQARWSNRLLRDPGQTGAEAERK